MLTHEQRKENNLTIIHIKELRNTVLQIAKITKHNNAYIWPKSKTKK